MDQRQAEMLYREMFRGEIVGADNEGNLVEKDTPLTLTLRLLDAHEMMYHRKLSQQIIEDDRSKAAAFLRQWADALESN